MKVPVNEPLLNGNEKKYLTECIDTGWISSEGPFVSEFEKKMAQISDRKHAIVVCNGSVALDVAVACLGIGPGDEVILPTFTIISCVLPIIRSGAIPVLVDSDLSTWNMNVNEIEAKITKKTKAIMVVHIYGLPVDMDPVLALAKKYNLKVIEDAAEVIGQTYKGRPCGSFGDVSTYSFYPNKHITTGEGGMVLVNDDTIADHCRRLRNLGFSTDPTKRFIHEELGWNFRMTNIQAALGLAQLERLPEFLKIKRKIGARYQELLSSLTQVNLPLKSTDFSENIYWVFGLVIKSEVKMTARDAMNELAQLGVATRPFFYPLHNQPILKKMGYFNEETYPNSEALYERGFYIPSGLTLTDEQIEHVVDSLKKVFK